MKDGNCILLILWTLIYSLCCGKLYFEYLQCETLAYTYSDDNIHEFG